MDLLSKLVGKNQEGSGGHESAGWSGVKGVD